MKTIHRVVKYFMLVLEKDENVRIDVLWPLWVEIILSRVDKQNAKQLIKSILATEKFPFKPNVTPRMDFTYLEKRYRIIASSLKNLAALTASIF